MKRWNVVAFALLCTLESEASLFASHSQRPHSPLHTPLPQPQKATSQRGYVKAIIREINPTTGLLTVETATEVMQVRLTPTEAQDFQVGETIQVQLLDADTRVM